jgi:hypothetical protein
MDHDQRFKTLLQTFFPEFFQLFFPDWAERFDFSTVEWLDTEVFPDPPEGTRRSLDLVAKLHAIESLAGESGEPAQDWLSLIHIEIESADSVQPLRRRMHWYYANLRQKHELPVLPLALYLSVGLDGIGMDEYREHYGLEPILSFRYWYVGLPRLNAIVYLERGLALGAALSALMQLPRDRRAWFSVEARQRIAAAGLDERRTFLLLECLESYLDLSPAEAAQADELLQCEEYREAKTMIMTTFQKGRQEGIALGLRRAILMQLEKQFGEVPPAVAARLERMTEVELDDLFKRAMDARSLAELDLANGK